MKTVTPNICTGYGYKKLDNNLLQDSDNPFGINYTPYSDIIFPHLTNTINKNICSLDPLKFTNFIDKMTIEYNSCIFNTSICIIDYFLIINFNNLTVNYTRNFYNNIKKCLNSTTYNRVFIPLNLRFENVAGHSNLIIIDKNEKKLYFFEPHGKMYDGEASNFINITSHIIKIVQHVFNLHEYNMYNVLNNCGPQTIQSYCTKFIKKEGFCLSWSLLIINLLLLNNTTPIKDVIGFLMSHSSDKLNCYIQKYSSYVHEYKPQYKCLKVLYSREKILSFNFNLTNEENKLIIYEINKSVKNHIYYNNNTLYIFTLFGNLPQYNKIYFKAINFYSKEKLNNRINEIMKKME